jgi:hypothetical protein
MSKMDKVKVYFMELNEEYGAMMNIGEKEYTDLSLDEVREKANQYIKVLSDVRGKDVTYMIEQNGGILAKIG